MASRNSIHGRSATASAQPTILNSRLPSATRRLALPAAAVATTATMPLPRLAPITRNSATFRLISPLATKAPVSNTTARLDQAISVNNAPIRMSSIGSPESEPKITLTPAAPVSGRAACRMICSARMMSPSPIAMRPIWPSRVALRVR